MWSVGVEWSGGLRLPSGVIQRIDSIAIGGTRNVSVAAVGVVVPDGPFGPPELPPQASAASAPHSAEERTIVECARI